VRRGCDLSADLADQGRHLYCQCTPDNPQTSVINEDSCPRRARQRLRTVQLSDGSEEGFCFKICQPTLAATPAASRWPATALASVTVRRSVCLTFGCEADKDCPLTTGKICDTATR